MAGALQETCFNWLVGLSLAHQSVYLGNEGKKGVLILQHSPFLKEQREGISSVAQSSLPWWRQCIPARFTNSSSLPWFSPELKPHPWLLLFWCAFPPASPAACLWPQQGTNSMLASNLISHAVYYLLFCSICHLLATRLPRDMSGGCMIHSITQSKIFSISLMAFCFSF